MTSIPFQQTVFQTSAATVNQAPADDGLEVAFCGRSNAGKSSALNRLTQQKRLARTSRTPGRTQLINFFSVSENQRLVDLPGYGYAKVPQSVKQFWQQHLDAYLRDRRSLVGLILLVDSRHPPKPFDLAMMEWAHSIMARSNGFGGCRLSTSKISPTKLLRSRR